MAMCPICRDYDGSPASVEGHISGCRDEDHQGEWGSAWREEIAGPFEAEEVDGDPSGDDGTDDANTSGVEGGVDGDELRDDAGSEGPSQIDVETASSTATGEKGVGEGVGTEIDPATALLVATALFALFVVVGAVLSDDDDGDDPAESDQEQSAQEPAQPEVPLFA